MRRFTTAVTAGAMILGTALAGITEAVAAPVSPAPFGKAAAGVETGMTSPVRHRHRHNGRHRHNDAAIALGAAGLFLGLTALASRPYDDPYYDDDYYYDGPVGYAYEPWSPAWYDDCSVRFRTFNPRTGKYKGYDGRYHFCR